MVAMGPLAVIHIIKAVAVPADIMVVVAAADITEDIPIAVAPVVIAAAIQA